MLILRWKLRCPAACVNLCSADSWVTSTLYWLNQSTSARHPDGRNAFGPQYKQEIPVDALMPMRCCRRRQRNGQGRKRSTSLCFVCWCPFASFEPSQNHPPYVKFGRNNIHCKIWPRQTHHRTVIRKKSRLFGCVFFYLFPCACFCCVVY